MIGQRDCMRHLSVQLLTCSLSVQEGLGFTTFTNDIFTYRLTNCRMFVLAETNV